MTTKEIQLCHQTTVKIMAHIAEVCGPSQSPADDKLRYTVAFVAALYIVVASAANRFTPTYEI